MFFLLPLGGARFIFLPYLSGCVLLFYVVLECEVDLKELLKCVKAFRIDFMSPNFQVPIFVYRTKAALDLRLNLQ